MSIEFNPQKEYGNRALFTKKLAEGYTRAAFGHGKLRRGEGPVALWIFTDNRQEHISTFEHYRGIVRKQFVSLGTEACEYDPQEFAEYVKMYKISIDEPISLTDIIKSFD
ncbi:hypothetical protein HZB03_00570 [Candidatus Woesearchaeota archaeon]|nr:hypothetical protein [Candidatus Woesearchaeota archaeon]